MKNHQGFILLISGPSGAGKSTLLKKLFNEFSDELYFSISCTTREPRNGEINGLHYHFISKDEFIKDIENGYFLEYAKVHENLYGTSLKHTKEQLKAGKIVVFDIDVQGFKIAKEKLGEKIVSIFITTKDKFELEKRLNLRASDTKESLENRLNNALSEMNELGVYDYLIINDDLDESYEKLRAIFLASKIKNSNQNLDKIKTNWSKGE